MRDTGDPVDGRGESRESEINARRFDRGRGGLDGGRRSRDLCLVCFDLRLCRLQLRLGGHVVLSGIVEILFGDGVVAEERRVAIHIQLHAMLVGFGDGDFRFSLCELCARLRQLALRLRKPPFGLIQVRLKWPWIDLEKHLALAERTNPRYIPVSRDNRKPGP